MHIESTSNQGQMQYYNRRPRRNEVEQTRPQILQKDDGLRMLREPANGFLNHAVNLVSEYHALDTNLIALFCRAAMRTSYSSDSALFHISTTGASGSGKNDIISKVIPLLPALNVVTFSSITPRVLYYSTHTDGIVDPYKYKNKVLAITEINDSKDFFALKAFAETDEHSMFTHATTSGAKNLPLSVVGPRAVWIASVDGPPDDQVQRRFFHVKITADNKESRQIKADLVLDNLLAHKTIETDDRIWAIKAAYEYMFEKGQSATFEPMNNATESLLREVAKQLVVDGFKTTAIKQFITLTEVASFEKSCVRGYNRMEIEDVLEAWFFLQLYNPHIVPEVRIGTEIYEPISPLRGEMV